MGLTGAMDMFVVILSTKCNQLYTPKPNCELFRKSFMFLELPSGILSPYMLKMQLRLTLLNVYIKNGNA